MKKQNYYSAFWPKRVMLFLGLFVIMTGAFAQWQLYTANVLPGENEPPFSPSGLAGAGLISNLIPDPTNPENSLLEIITVANADNGTWRMVYADAVTDVTVVMRVKSANDNGRRVIELDLDNGGFRERLYLNQEDDKIRLQHSDGFGHLNEFSLPNDGSVKDWHIYRITKSATGAVNLYVDEDPVPLAEGQTNVTTSNNHFRFGDTNGSHNISGLVDWIIWDVSGTYAPGEGTPIPPELLGPTTTNWRFYDGSVLPNESVPTFMTASGSFNPTENMIIEDPDVPGNYLLWMDVSGNPQNAFLWRMNFIPPGIEFEELTVVLRVKGNPDREMAMDLDLDFNATRSRISIHQGSPPEARVRNGSPSGLVVPLTIDINEWHVYRFTMTATDTKMYIDEDPEPMMEFAPVSAGSNRHFRFGDGDSGRTFGANIDWVIWDYTGAYAPGEGSPIPSPVITPSWDANLATLLFDGNPIPGFDPETTFYEVILPAGTTDVPIVSATTSFNGATLAITQAATLPDTAFVVVTAFNGFTTKTYSVRFAVDPTGIERTPGQSFRIFPNPAGSHIIIQLQNEPGNASIEIFGVDGQMISRKLAGAMTETLNIGHLQPGVYILRLITDDGIVSKKLLKN